MSRFRYALSFSMVYQFVELYTFPLSFVFLVSNFVSWDFVGYLSCPYTNGPMKSSVKRRSLVIWYLNFWSATYLQPTRKYTQQATPEQAVRNLFLLLEDQLYTIALFVLFNYHKPICSANLETKKTQLFFNAI